MEQNSTPNIPTPQNSAVRNSKNKWQELFMYALFTSLLVAIAGYGVYSWQQTESDEKVQALNQQIKTLEAKSIDTNTIEDDKEIAREVVYRSRIGGLTLKLPNEYGVIVKADGNKGGAPGSELHFGVMKDNGVLENSWTDQVQFDIDHMSPSLENAAQNLSRKLIEEDFNDLKTENSTLGGVPAKIVAGEINGGFVAVRAYVAVSGEFTYTLITKGASAKEETDKFKAVLSGTKIEKASIN